MTVDLTRAVVLLCAAIDDDDPDGAAAIARQVDPIELCRDVLHLCLQLGRVAYGSDAALRVELGEALSRTVTSQDEQP